jgi:hypothetical protein
MATTPEKSSTHLHIHINASFCHNLWPLCTSSYEIYHIVLNLNPWPMKLWHRTAATLHIFQATSASLIFTRWYDRPCAPCHCVATDNSSSKRCHAASTYGKPSLPSSSVVTPRPQQHLEATRRGKLRSRVASKHPRFAPRFARGQPDVLSFTSHPSCIQLRSLNLGGGGGGEIHFPRLCTSYGHTQALLLKSKLYENRENLVFIINWSVSWDFNPRAEFVHFHKNKIDIALV